MRQFVGSAIALTCAAAFSVGTNGQQTSQGEAEEEEEKGDALEKDDMKLKK